jgi:hypothetical protein
MNILILKLIWHRKLLWRWDSEAEAFTSWRFEWLLQGSFVYHPRLSCACVNSFESITSSMSLQGRLVYLPRCLLILIFIQVCKLLMKNSPCLLVSIKCFHVKKNNQTISTCNVVSSRLSQWSYKGLHKHNLAKNLPCLISQVKTFTCSIDGKHQIFF